MALFETMATMTHKGFLIGFISATIKGASEIRRGNFKFVIFLADMVMSCLVGYSMWELMANSDLALWSKYMLTVLMSLNSFVLVTILTNAKYLLLLTKVLVLRDTGSFNELVDTYGKDIGLTVEVRDGNNTTYNSSRNYPDDRPIEVNRDDNWLD